MRAIIQRVQSANLTEEGKQISQIGQGLCVYLGINQDDTIENAKKLAKKLVNLRVFRDENEKINYSVKDIKGEVMIVSNFTIYADCSRGTRPNFMYAMKSEPAKKLYEEFVKLIEKENITAKQGVFGGHMKIEQINDGPVNIVLEF